jgi:asparagine synthase (glutamine-hydrolysing)
MFSADERYVMVFNGEVYNYQTFRDALLKLGHTFKGHSDSEAMLAAICEWGIEKAVEQFNGMFAFAVYDRRERLLHIVRDRLGIKPLYYTWANGVFLFGSELKTLMAHPCFSGEINRDAVALYLRHGYIPAPHTIYKHVYKLPQGSMLTVRDAQSTQPIAYWSAQTVMQDAARHPFTGSPSEAVDALDALLRDAVQLQMISDVPLGAFLSGGVDSSTVVALMQAQSQRPVHTFTIGFHEAQFNEAPYAKAVAQHLGTHHTELYVTPAEARAVIPQLADWYDEPFADSSQIPTYLVSKLARQHVTVTLSGDGGDELFAGYERYAWSRGIHERMNSVPGALRALAARAITAVPPSVLDQIGGLAGLKRTGDRAHKLAEILTFESPAAMYRDLISLWKQPTSVVRHAHEPSTLLMDRQAWANSAHFTAWMQTMDLALYLPDDILTKVDRASMGISLESRVPILDHRVVEFAARLPLDYKVRDGQTKWALRQVLYRYVPRELIDRPKSGFAVPIGDWLRGDLRAWAEALLDEGRLREGGIFQPEPIRKLWAEHLGGTRNWQHHLWCILMFEAWRERWNVPA